MISILTIVSVILFYFYGKRIFASDEQEEIFDKKVKKIKKETSDALDRFYCFAFKWLIIGALGALFVWAFGYIWCIIFIAAFAWDYHTDNLKATHDKEISALKENLTKSK